MSSMNPRLEIFNKLDEDPWYSRQVEKLSSTDKRMVESFLKNMSLLGLSAFEKEATRFFIDDPERPKNYTLIVEILVIVNHKARNLLPE